MAYYAYKTVRDLLPEHIIKQMGDDYEGDGNYDGDQWYAAEAYILELIEQRDAAQATATEYQQACDKMAMDHKIERDRLREALEKLARLGNEPHYGNSVGNVIAIAALKGDV